MTTHTNITTSHGTGGSSGGITPSFLCSNGISSNLTAALGLGDDIMRRAVFLYWVENVRDQWTDLPTKHHIIEGAD